MVALHGAELRAWRVADRPLIWTPDPAIWAETAPLLFPIVGWTRGGAVRVEGRSYPLGLHGFARTMPFRLAERGPDRVRLVLTASRASRTAYPFDFSLSVTYRLTDTTLRTVLRVENTGPAAMPYACGLHPGFCWPFAGGEADDYAITFAEQEDATVPVIAANGLFTRESRALPIEAKRLALSDALLSREALCLLNMRSRSLRFAHRNGAAIAVGLENFPHIALWSRPGGRFLSIEAWTGHGDYTDSDGDLWTKPSMIRLDPGAAREHGVTYDFSP